MAIDFKLIDYGTPAWKEAVKLRESILREPLGSHFSDEELDDEKDDFQVVGYREKVLIACAVLVPEGSMLKMQRVAVADAFRNANIGSDMMVFCEKFALSNGFNSIYCHARDSAVKFYLRNGYSPQGDYFEEDGIPHIKMNKELAQHA